MQRKRRRALTDLAVILAVALLTFALAEYLEAFEAFVEWSRRYERYDVDELLLVPAILGMAFGVYSWRRWRDLKEEISRREALEEQLTYQATHDGLTSLPNRELFTERLEAALARDAGDRKTIVAVLFVDLDDFTAANDSMGHAAGDELLRAVAGRLSASLRPGDTAARFGGDEFMVLIEDAAGAEEANRLAERITRKLGKPFRIGGRDVSVTTSIGVALGTPSRDEAGQLLHHADLAMYRAKEDGKARYEVFGDRQEPD